MENKLCGAKTRAGTPCKKAPITGMKRCANHGGKTPVGVDSPHFKHGRYSKYAKSILREIIDDVDKQPLDLLPELQLQRALLQYYLENTAKQKELSLDQIVVISQLTQDVSRNAWMIVKVRKDISFTPAELKFIQTRMRLITQKYIPDPKQRIDFINEIIDLYPDDEAEPKRLKM